MPHHAKPKPKPQVAHSHETSMAQAKQPMGSQHRPMNANLQAKQKELAQARSKLDTLKASTKDMNENIVFIEGGY